MFVRVQIGWTLRWGDMPHISVNVVSAHGPYSASQGCGGSPCALPQAATDLTRGAVGSTQCRSPEHPPAAVMAKVVCDAAWTECLAITKSHALRRWAFALPGIAHRVDIANGVPLCRRELDQLVRQSFAPTANGFPASVAAPLRSASTEARTSRISAQW